MAIDWASMTDTQRAGAIVALLNINNDLYARIAADAMGGEFPGLHAATRIVSAEIQKGCGTE